MSGRTGGPPIDRSLAGALGALAIVLVANALSTPGFASIEWRDGRFYGALVDVAQNGAPVALLALGMAVVLATGGIDLSVGAVMALGATCAALVLQRSGSAAGAACAGLAAGTVAGLWNGALVSLVRLQPIVATLLLLFGGRGIAQALTNDQKVRFSSAAFERIGSGTAAGVPVPVLIVVGAGALIGALARFTVLGLYTNAVGVNPRAAKLCGLPVARVRTAAYVTSGICAAAAGIIAASDIREADVASCGLYAELDAVLACVIGGVGLRGGPVRVLGPLVGALTMQSLTVGLQMRGVATEHALIVKAFVAVLAGAAQLVAHRVGRRSA